MKKDIIRFETCLIVALMILCTCLSFALYKQKVDYVQKRKEPSAYEKLLIYNSIESLKYSNMQIKDFKVLNSKGEEKLFSDYLSSQLILILKYSSHNCISCIDMELESLMKFAESKGLDRVMILTDNSNFRELKAMLTTRHMSQIQALLILENEETQFYHASPMLFLTNDKMQLSMPFIPIKEVSGYSEKYYKLIRDLI